MLSSSVKSPSSCGSTSSLFLDKSGHRKKPPGRVRTCPCPPPGRRPFPVAHPTQLGQLAVVVVSKVGQGTETHIFEIKDTRVLSLIQQALESLGHGDPHAPQERSTSHRSLLSEGVDLAPSGRSVIRALGSQQCIACPGTSQPFCALVLLCVVSPGAVCRRRGQRGEVIRPSAPLTKAGRAAVSELHLLLS